MNSKHKETKFLGSWDTAVVFIIQYRCFGSGSAFNRLLDPEGVKAHEIQDENEATSRIVHHKKIPYMPVP
jgi:hypothetical protein